MADEKRPETVEEFHAEFLREALARRAVDLRRLADEFDLLADRVGKTATYSQLAQDAVYKLAWGTANFGMERVINEAAGADVAKAKGEQRARPNRFSYGPADE